MGLRWGREGPPEVAYSRVTRDLSEVYAGLPADVSRRLQRLAGEFEVRVRRGRPSELDLRQPWPDDARVAGIREVFVLTPARATTSTVWHTPGEARALGVRRGRREWAPWPARSLAGDI